MTTWTLDQVVRVCNLRARAEIETHLLDRMYAKDALLEKMAKALIQDAHPLGVEVHPEDLRIRSNVDPEQLVTRVEMAWAPDTLEVELVGGPEDGNRLQIQSVMDHLVLPQQDGPNLEYRLSGWLEQERVWAFGLKP